MVLATVSAEGSPRATSLYFYADDELRLYWLSSADSVHSRNIERVGGVAAAIHASATDWRNLRGVQIEGVASVAAHREDCLLKYRAHFGLTGPELEPVIARSDLYVLTPRWMRYIDNTVEFGFKRDFVLS